MERALGFRGTAAEPATARSMKPARRTIEKAKAKGEKVDFVMPPDDGDNPVFIDGVKPQRASCRVVGLFSRVHG